MRFQQGLQDTLIRGADQSRIKVGLAISIKMIFSINVYFFEHCQTVVKLLSNCCPTVVQLLSNCCPTVVKLLSNCCQTVVKLLSNCCQTVVKILLDISVYFCQIYCFKEKKILMEKVKRSDSMFSRDIGKLKDFL